MRCKCSPVACFHRSGAENVRCNSGPAATCNIFPADFLERLLESLAGGLSLNERQVRLVGTRLECARKTKKNEHAPQNNPFSVGRSSYSRMWAPAPSLWAPPQVNKKGPKCHHDFGTRALSCWHPRRVSLSRCSSWSSQPQSLPKEPNAVIRHAPCCRRRPGVDRATPSTVCPHRPPRWQNGRRAAVCAASTGRTGSTRDDVAAAWPLSCAVTVSRQWRASTHALARLVGVHRRGGHEAGARSSRPMRCARRVCVAAAAAATAAATRASDRGGGGRRVSPHGVWEGVGGTGHPCVGVTPCLRDQASTGSLFGAVHTLALLALRSSQLSWWQRGALDVVGGGVVGGGGRGTIEKPTGWLQH